ncbi:MAG: cytochrome C oxidase subunit IV family protein [Verrucomicrobia bacterium]|nr:cytochrome C oxidase subunit IV family protein [Verrucomicrobiota bacterium]
MNENVESIRQRLKIYRWIFVVLLALTGATAGIFYLYPGGRRATAIALMIATIQAVLASAYFMHLNSEKKMVLRILLFTGIFFLGLMFLTLLALHDQR